MAGGPCARPTAGRPGGPATGGDRARRRRARGRRQPPLHRDVHALHRDNAALAELARRRDEFLASASHNLRTPPTSVLSFCDPLADPASGPLGAEQQEFLAAIRRNAERMASVITALLQTSVLREPRRRLEFGAVDVARLVEHAVRDRMPTLTAAGVFTVLRCAPGPVRTGSVGLGGNGQFTRLSALDRIAATERRPWKRGALLEDYELGLHMILAGFRLTHLSDTWVSQEGLPHLRRLLTQRTRWAQGSLQCVRYAPRIVSSRHYSGRGVLETLSTSGQPVAHLVTLGLTVALLVLGGFGALTLGPLGPILAELAIGPFLLWGPVYRRDHAPEASRLTALLWGATRWLYAYHLFVVSARGFVPMLRGRNGWAKTRRNAEPVTDGPVARES
ncbi:glycosyltransferase family 2 protein [Streptomyces noursei]|uniref:glycosyltransferase family 2 protein n=1 Tax=Streptomyces noursei TaxID=1971 RepID=UPI000B1914AC